MKRGRWPAPGLRGKMVLAAAVLLVIPWVGYSYLKAMERLLQETQAQQLVATARAAATALQDRPKLVELRTAGSEDGSPAATPATEEVRLLLAGLARAGLRIWVVDSKLRLVAGAGSIDTPAAGAAPATFGPLERLLHAALVPVFDRVYPAPARSGEETIPNELLAGRDVERALDGAASSRRRPGSDGRSAILSAIHPVWVGDAVVAALIVEETTDAILSLRDRAFEKLVAVTLIAFCAAALVLLLFASRIATRLRRLRDEAENAIDSQGRVRHIAAGGHARDEIGDLSRSFSTVLARLAEHNAYLEQLAGRLSHELRTPIAVVRSSLDNARLHVGAPEAGVYLDRAETGVARLETILTRMTEATRLEQIARDGERERFDICAVVSGCVAGYAAAYPRCRFALSAPDVPLAVHGIPDLVAQLLDKLAANAVDFSTGGGPVEVSLAREGADIVLAVSNRGPLLPAEMKDRLFESMVSIRPDRQSAEPHLGLGLHVVRLITELHGGRVRAFNRADGGGVTVEVRLPAAG